jgi:hypothetical protein
MTLNRFLNGESSYEYVSALSDFSLLELDLGNYESSYEGYLKAFKIVEI